MQNTKYSHNAILQGNEYATSLAYDATKEDELLSIFSILSEVKDVINRYLGQS